MLVCSNIWLDMAPDDRGFPPEVEREGALITCVNGQWSGAASAVLVFWLFLLVSVASMIYSYWLVRLYVVGVTTVFLVIGSMWPGGMGEFLAERASIPVVSDDKTTATNSPIPDSNVAH